MRKKAVILMVLLLLLLVPSVIAIPKNKEPKTKTTKTPNNQKIEKIIITESATLEAGNIYLGNHQIDDTGILYVQNAISTGKINNGISAISGFEP